MIYYDNNDELVHYEVEAAQNTYLAFGYGTDMTNTDMVAWIT